MSRDAVFGSYVQELNQKLATGDASEHSHRPALAALIEAIEGGLNVINEPKRIKCGAPDLRVLRGDDPLGYIETKDIGMDLGQAERSEQLKRYRESLPNLILTDYLEFRWFVEGKHRETARLATIDDHGKVHWTREGVEAISRLFEGFFAQEPPEIGRAQELAQGMAKLAHLIRISIEKALEQESETGSLHGQLKAFQDTLIPDLKPAQFADMYAQTIAYGLFAAWEPFPDNKRFTRQEAAWNLPKTNPFLRKLFNDIAGVGLDDRVAWLADDLAFLLDRADKATVLKDFGKVTKQEDPVVHFYEDFLKAYDPKMRKSRGVYYTPEPVVSYIVRSIDYLLKTKFDKSWGLADKDVMILDPACGTGTFLYFVIQQIYDTLEEKGQLGGWNDYVKNHLLPRIFGFELLMAPYTVAHMKLGMLLKNLGYDFTGDQRLEIYLTNSLGETITKAETSAAFREYITEEGIKADSVKREKKIMVVLGNPPYSVSSVNKGPQIEKLMERYKTAVRGERNIQPLSDDYIKFIRFAHDRIERTGYGIIGMITNNSYLSGLIHRGMREELLKTFDEIYILNLHGNSLIGETAPGGGKDENVFDIRQGVGISILTKKKEPDGEKVVRYEDVEGVREGKYKYLFSNELGTTEWHKIEPTKANYYFIISDKEKSVEYENGWQMNDIFIFSRMGITSGDDDLFYSFKKSDLVRALKIVIRNGYDKEKGVAENIRKNLKEIDESKIIDCLYRAFDKKYLYYDKSFLCRARPDLLGQIEEEKANLGIATLRRTRENSRQHFFITKMIIDKSVISSRDNAYLFPLYLYKSFNNDERKRLISDVIIREPNLSSKFIAAVEGKLGIKFKPDGKGDLEGTFGPEDVLHYMYAIFHSPTYRFRYAEFLKIDFPWVPLTSDRELFRKLCGLGEELVGLHLMESTRLEDLVTTFPVAGDNVVEEWRYVEVASSSREGGIPRNDGGSVLQGGETVKHGNAWIPHQVRDDKGGVRDDKKRGRVYINKTQYFEGIEREVWEFHIGGYQVLQKWLKDRKGRKLSWEDQQHYQKIVVALTETMRLMGEIDQAIPGWPIE